jgi:hypothetical protein
LDKAARASAIANVKEFSKSMPAQLRLMPTLRADSPIEGILRLHAREMVQTQNVLLDLMDTPLGYHLTNTYLKARSKRRASRLYAIVVPIQKDAEFTTSSWRLSR